MQFDFSFPALRRIVFLLGVVAILSLLPGCRKRETPAEAGIRTQTFHIVRGSEPQELDPHAVIGDTEHQIMMSLLEGLVSPDPVDLHAVPGVAESWDISPDRKIYTFHLRHNAKWSNGDPVTAQDFISSYKRALTPAVGYQYSYMLYVVHNAEAYNTNGITDFNQVGFKALDDYTFQVTLDNPTPYVLSLMCHPSWFPVHIPTIAKYGDPFQRGSKWTRPGRFVGNGPFVLTEWKVNYKIVVKKNTNYWNAANVKLNGIVFHAIENQDSEERAFRAGQLHVNYQLSSGKIDRYRREHPELLHIDPHLATYFYKINVTKPPLNDKRVRQALAMAIDRESIVTNVLRGGQFPAYSLTPPNTAGYTPRAKIPRDLNLARKLLADAGYPGGKGLPPIEILYNTQEDHKRIAEALQQMWKQNLGVDARLLNEEWKVYLDSVHSQNYQVARQGWIGDYPDPNTFLDMWVTDGGNNETGWSNPEYDRLIKEAARTVDPAQRLEVFQKAEAILMDEVPIIPIYVYTRVFLQQPYVKGFYPNILDEHPYQYIWLAPDSELNSKAALVDNLSKQGVR
jgi:oligopeptide transport system substrate-binding protein